MTHKRPLPDDDFRDSAVETLDKNQVVVAGAGTGKTTLLIRRILRLLEKGTPCEKIAAITFTEAAAAELRTRLRASLEKKPIALGGGQTSSGGSGCCLEPTA